jgi:hypothetical protein
MRLPSAVLALALLAGCGGSWSKSYDFAGEKLSVIAWNGRVALRNGAPGRVEVSVRGGAEGTVSFATASARGPVLQVDTAAKDADLVLEIAAPPGISLSVVCSGADVDVSGRWGAIEITTDGAIEATADAVSGSLAGRRGGVSFVAEGAGPTGEMRIEATSGDVSATLPAAWTGQLKFQTRTGRVDVPTHDNLQTIWDEDKRGVVGRMGPRRKEGEPLSTVWVVSGTGNVSFRLRD